MTNKDKQAIADLLEKWRIEESAHGHSYMCEKPTDEAVAAYHLGHSYRLQLCRSELEAVLKRP